MKKIIIVIIFLLSPVIFWGQGLFTESGGEYKFISTDVTCIPQEVRERIISQNKKTIELLKKNGKVQSSFGMSSVKFKWPLRASINLTDYDYYGISGFVDHNNSYPNKLLDYNGGVRTYDRDNGYNHKGTDIFTWPFSWYKMDYDQVEVIAAADGIILSKEDGHFDRSCSAGENNWNAVYLVHADGSQSWYGHMKKNSVTSKNAGEYVAAGEYLGIVGSSGSSTGPHLHFEVYDDNYNLIDPWFGPYNPTITSSWWENQKPYYDPAVNKVSTHYGWPQWPECPQQEIPKFKNEFLPGETIYLIAYYRDQLRNMTSYYRITTPDNIIWQEWSEVFNASDHYAASWWGRSYTLPTNASLGNWTFSVSFNNNLYTHTFKVSNSVNVEDEIILPNEFFVSSNYPNPFNPETKISYELPTDEFVIFKLYDTLGREIKRIENGLIKAGSYNAVINIGEFSSGIYLLEFNAGKYSKTQKILLLK